MDDDRPTIFIVDDDRSVRTALARLMRSRKLRAETFASGQEFLDREPADAPGCIVLDLKMPGVTGLELQEDLTTAGINLPIVFLTGHGDVPASVTAMKGGAVDFFEKPVDEDELMDAIKQAVEWDVDTRERRIEQIEVQGRINSLTPRELQVFSSVVQGSLNKQIASNLGMSEKTVKVHRARVMQKMQAESLAGLVRLAERTGTHSVTAAAPLAG
jgi:FixJ family two-component response regulator